MTLALTPPKPKPFEIACSIAMRVASRPTMSTPSAAERELNDGATIFLKKRRTRSGVQRELSALLGFQNPTLTAALRAAARIDPTTRLRLSCRCGAGPGAGVALNLDFLDHGYASIDLNTAGGCPSFASQLAASIYSCSLVDGSAMSVRTRARCLKPCRTLGPCDILTSVHR